MDGVHIHNSHQTKVWGRQVKKLKKIVRPSVVFFFIFWVFSKNNSKMLVKNVRAGTLWSTLNVPKRKTTNDKWINTIHPLPHCYLFFLLYQWVHQLAYIMMETKPIVTDLIITNNSCNDINKINRKRYAIKFNSYKNKTENKKKNESWY